MPHAFHHVGFFRFTAANAANKEHFMNRLLLIVTALLALTLCGIASANYQYGNGVDDRFDRKSNELRRFDYRPFDRTDFRRFGDGDEYRRFNEWWFDSNRKGLPYFDDRPFDLEHSLRPWHRRLAFPVLAHRITTVAEPQEIHSGSNKSESSDD
jgi:hypothetical protein